MAPLRATRRWPTALAIQSSRRKIPRVADLRGTVVVTGASGFIGGRLAGALVEQGVDLVTFVRKSSPAPKHGRSIAVDYLDPASVERAIADADPRWIFHNAGTTKGVTLGDFVRANVEPTRNICAAIEKHAHKIERFVYVSSLTAYGPAPLDRPLEEGAERKPIEFYGKSKLEAEQIVESIASFPWTIIRPAGVYGPGDADFYVYFRLASRGLNVFYGNRARTMSLVHVDDLVRAMLLAAGSEKAIRRGYFISAGPPVSFEEFQTLIAGACERKQWTLDLPGFLVPLAAMGGELISAIDGKPRLVNRQKAVMGKQDAWTCTSARAMAELGYAPRIALAEGIQSTYAWYKESGWL
jgi:nucleoside-diphosphate-sugar epimerase